ncbi:DUF421 domain-containing protein [Paenibacillus yanchengensis]|uniref:DUF421 domain-containing protein n=1 Tax=Paenibacillus yanchengensis TaxID=2035833 RepID=A0ABW4YLW8_9BACL
MELLMLSARTAIIYIIVFITMRIMGKREVGQLSLLDLIISLMIADIAVVAIEDLERSIWAAVFPLLVLIFFQVSTAFISMKNRKIRLFLDGKPSVIIANGDIYHDVMRKQRYTLDDLLLQLRENQIASIDEVAFAILETNGKLSVIPKEPEEQQTRNKKAAQINIPKGYRYEILPIPLIMHGEVQNENLEKLNKNRFWLKQQLQERQVDQFKDVFFCSINQHGELYFNLKDNKSLKPSSN